MMSKIWQLLGGGESEKTNSLIGIVLRQRYKIIKELGGGGIADTYLAIDLDIPVSPKPKCIVKRIKPQMQHSEILRLFRKEGEILYRLGQNHPQIPQLYAYFEENQQFYLVQELIDGHDLSQEIMIGKRWSETEVIKLSKEILEVLAYVHEHGVIHRDIKPSNIMRRRDNGKLILIDFGIVKELGTQVVDGQGQTKSTIVAGTPGYMPIEQDNGHPKFCSDVYAVGIIAIEALTGIPPKKLPIDPNTLEVIWRDRAQVSDAFGDALTKMVRYYFNQRYQSAAEALQALTLIQPQPSKSPITTSKSVQKAVSLPTEPLLPPVTTPTPIEIFCQIIFMEEMGWDLSDLDAWFFSEGLAGVKIGKKYGYIDRRGQLVIQPQFDGVLFFSEGLAPVQIGEKWGFIDKRGQLVIQPQFDGVLFFSEGLAPVQIGEKWGFIDKKGQLVIQPQFDWVWFFSEGLAGLKVGEKYGYIDNRGQLVIQPQFDWVWFFSEGLAGVKIGEKYGFIDKKGQLVIQPQFDWIWFFSEGLVPVQIGEEWGFIDNREQLVIQPQFDGVLFFSEGLAPVQIGEKYSYIDNRGQLVIQPQFDGVLFFSEGLAPVQISDKWGFINNRGQLVIQPQFDGVLFFSEGLAPVQISDKWGFIDKTGKFIYERNI
ncbi:MAG: WG repeat-containing protein [Xenococcaceae cyanobacterium]